MTYRAPLPLRLFHYALWALMLFIVIWFIILPLASRAVVGRLVQTAPASPAAARSDNTP